MEWLNSLKDTITGLSGKPAPDASEKRKTYRIACSMPVVVQINSKEALAGRLTNLSTTGLKLRFPRTLKTGQDYVVRIRGKAVPGGNPARELSVQATAVWCRRSVHGDGYDVGLTFSGFVGVRMNQVLDFFKEELGISITESDQKRRTTRVAKRFSVTYTGGDGKVQNGFIRNISMSGLQIASRVAVDPGQDLDVTIDFSDKHDKMHATAEVVRCRKIPREEWFEIGARLKGLTDKEQQKLVSLVTAYMKEAWAEG